MWKKLGAGLLLAVYLGALLFGAVSDDVGKFIKPGMDKILHLLEFLVLSALLYLVLWAFDVRHFRPVWVFVIAVPLALFSELIQLLTMSRVFDWLDLGYDLAGIIIFLLVLMVMEWIYSKQ